MKLENVKPFVIKTQNLLINKRTVFFVLEDNPSHAIDFLPLTPFGIKSIVEPRFDPRGVILNKDVKLENAITADDDIDVFDIRRISIPLLKNKPFAINLNSMFAAVERSQNLRFNWRSKIPSARVIKSIKSMMQLISKSGFNTVLLYSINAKKQHPKNIFATRVYPILNAASTGDKIFNYIGVNYVDEFGDNSFRTISNFEKFDMVKSRILINKLLNQTGKDSDPIDKLGEIPDALVDTISKNINTTNYKSILKSKLNMSTKNAAIKALAVMDTKQIDDKEKDDFITKVVAENISKSQIQSYLNKNIGVVLDYSQFASKQKIKKDSIINEVNESAANIMTKDVDVSQLANRRGVEMNQIFMDSINKVVNDLENKSGKFQIKIKNVKLVQLNNSNDVKETVEDELRITYTNHAGKNNVLKFKIPRLIENNYFKHYGQKKALVYQIIPDIVTKPKPDVVRVASNYSIVKITKKSPTTKFFYDMFIGGKKLPISVPLMYWFGIEKFFNYISLPFTTSKSKERGSILINGLYYSFSPKKTMHTGIINGINRTLGKFKPEVLNSFNSEYPKKFILKVFEEIFGNSRMIFVLDSIFENFVDPLTRDIAVQRNIPTDFHKLLVYAVEFLEVAEVTRPTDLTQSRLRYSEVITLSIAKALNASYTDFKSRAAIGDKEAQLFIDPNTVIKSLNESTLLALVESANPIEEIQTLTRVKPMGPGGIPSKAAATLAMRNIDDTHYGTIDPIDTPESDSIGISRQLVVSQDLTNSAGYFKQYEKGKGKQIFGIGSALTPYANFDDGNRLQMAANQVRQAIPIINPEQPLVQTGYETAIRSMLSDNFVKRSPVDGEISMIITDKLIRVADHTGKEHDVDLTPVKLNSGTGKSSGSLFNVKINLGDKVIKDQIIAEGSHIKDGTLSMGRTMLSGVMAYGGYTFEDSLMISERVAKEHKLTSIHVLEFQLFFDKESPIDFLADVGATLKDGSPMAIFKKVGVEGIIMDVDDFDENDNDSIDIIDSVNNRTILSPAGTIIDIQIYAATAINPKYRQYQVGKIGGHVYKGQPMEKNYIVFKVKQELMIGVGDKLCNRHGNKGVIGRVVKVEDMPTWRGIPFDILYSPLSITGRMNMGQIFETYLGLCLKELRIIVLRNQSSKQKVIEEIKFFYETLDVSKNKAMSKDTVIRYKRIVFSNNYKKFILELENGKDFSIVVPPFNEPKLKQIQKVMKRFGLKDSYKIKLPELGVETLTPINVGYQTWYKLEHLSENKIHARSIGAVGANLQGVAGKKRGGAAKLGELDISALISHGVSDFLKESFSLLSDDHTKKTEAINNIIENGETHLSNEAASSPTKSIMSNYLLGMQLSVQGLNEIKTIKEEKEK